MNPDVSVVILADYAPGDAGTYNGLRAALRGLANQSFIGAAEFILVESDCLRDRLPGDLTAVLPALRTVFSGAQDSFSLRNIGVRHATGDIVAFLDADCVPERDWLARLVAAFDRKKNIAAVSGRTTYGEGSLLKRTLALFSRAYVDRGDAGEVRQISNNNAAYRRSILVSHPFPSGVSPFIAALQAGAIMSAGGRLWFEPRARGVPAYGGGGGGGGGGVAPRRLGDGRHSEGKIKRAFVLVVAAGRRVDSGVRLRQPGSELGAPAAALALLWTGLVRSAVRFRSCDGGQSDADPRNAQGAPRREDHRYSLSLTNGGRTPAFPDFRKHGSMAIPRSWTLLVLNLESWLST